MNKIHFTIKNIFSGRIRLAVLLILTGLFIVSMLSCKFYPAISEVYEHHITLHIIGNLDNTPYAEYNDYTKLNPNPAYTNFDITKSEPFFTNTAPKYVKFVLNKIVLESTEKSSWIGGPPVLLDTSTVVNFLSNTEVIVTNCNDLPAGILYDKISIYVSEVQTIGTDLYDVDPDHDFLTNRIDADLNLSVNYDPLSFSSIYRVGDEDYFNGLEISDTVENSDVYLYMSIRNRYYLKGKFDYTYNVDGSTGVTNSIITNIIAYSNSRYTASSLYPKPFLYITNM